MRLYVPHLTTPYLVREIRRTLQRTGRTDELALRDGASARALAELGRARDDLQAPTHLSGLYYHVGAASPLDRVAADQIRRGPPVDSAKPRRLAKGLRDRC